MHGQAHHDASQSTNLSASLTPPPLILPSIILTPHCPARLAVKPVKQSTTTHDDDYAARRTAAVHSARTASTTCVDPHPKTLWSTAPLKSGLAPPPFSFASLIAQPTPRACMGACLGDPVFPSPCNDPCMTTKPTHRLCFFNARATTTVFTPFSSFDPHPPLAHVYLCSFYTLSTAAIRPLIFRPTRPRHHLGVRDSLIARR